MLSRLLSRWLGRVLAALLALLALVATLDLGAWVLFDHSWAEVEEIQGILMIWFGLLGAAYALAEGLHLALELVVARLPETWRRVALRLASSSVVVFGALLTVHAWRLAGAVSNTLPATGWSASLQYWPAVFAGALLALLGIEQVIHPPAAATPLPGIPGGGAISGEGARSLGEPG